MIYTFTKYSNLADNPIEFASVFSTKFIGALRYHHSPLLFILFNRFWSTEMTFN